jgi:SAM-dependent methyltransferase
VRPFVRKWLFETLYKNRYLYRFASTVPFAGQWRIWQRLVLPRIYGKDVLELGCGLGDLQADMLEAGFTCHAVEHSPEMVSAARATLKRRKVGKEAQVMQGSAQHLPFDAASFDTVVSTFPSEYIYDPATISEIERVLRPEGRLIVIEGANLLPVGFVQPFLVGVQALVYGPAAVFGPRAQRNLDEEVARSKQGKGETDVITDVVPDAWFGRHIPLGQCGLRRRSERVRSSRWEVYITIGEKV